MNQERITLLKKYIEETPLDPFPHYALALELWEIDPLETEKLFSRLLQDFKNYLPTYYMAGLFFSELQKKERAMEIFEKGIQVAQETHNKKTEEEIRAALSDLQYG